MTDIIAPTDTGTVSVIVPCFNAGQLLLDALVSITEQRGNFTLLEVLVVDDHSSDPATREVLLKLEQTPKVRVLANAGRKGPAGARNTGAFAAQGHWLAFLDADDLWLPDSLAARFVALDTYPGARFISGDFQIWDPETGNIEENFFRSRPEPSVFYGPAYRQAMPVRLPRPFRDTLFTALCSSCSTIVARELFMAAGGFEESLMYKEDHHFWFKLSKLTDLILVPQSVFHYRQHGGNMTKRECTPFEYERVMLDFVLQSEVLPELRAQINARYASGFVQDAQWFRARGRFGAALGACLAGLRRAPGDPKLWRQLIAALAYVR